MKNILSLVLLLSFSIGLSAQITKTAATLYFSGPTPSRSPVNLNSESEFAITTSNSKVWVWDRIVGTWKEPSISPSQITGSATIGQYLGWNGTNWVPSNIQTLTTISGNGTSTSPLFVTPNTIGFAELTTNSVDSTKIRQQSISAGDLNSMGASIGQVLKWSGSVWYPSNDNIGSDSRTNLLSGSSKITITNGINAVLGTTPVSVDIVESNLNIQNIGGSLTNSQIPPNSLTLDKINQSSSVSGQVIGYTGSSWTPIFFSGDVTGAYNDLQIASNAVSTTEIANGAVTLQKLADSSVNNSKIINGAITGLKISDMGATVGQVLTYAGVGIGWQPQTITASTSISIYDAGNGCLVMAAGSGVTFTRTTSSIWTLTIPSDVLLYSCSIYTGAASNPGSNVTIQIRTTSTVFNQNIETSHIPLIWGVALSGGTTGNYAPTTGTINLFPTIASTPSNGDIDFLLNNFNASASLGTGATLLKLVF